MNTSFEIKNDIQRRELFNHGFDESLIPLFIDHTLLKPGCQEDQIRELCSEANEFKVRSVCIPARFVGLAAQLRNACNATYRICTVAAFPLGHESLRVKITESLEAIEHGAQEIDFVQNISLASMNAFSQLEKETRDLVEKIRQAKKDTIVKVILETCYLNEEQITSCAKAHLEGGVDYLKTSTGFGTDGAKTPHIALLSNLAKPWNAGVKASGGIRTREQFMAMVGAGATRIGTSAAATIIGINQKKKDKEHDESSRNY